MAQKTEKPKPEATSPKKTLTREQKLEELKKEIENFFKVSPKQIETRLDIIRRFLDIIRGVRDIQGRLAPLTDPRGLSILTMSRLTVTQAQAMGDIYTLDKLYGFFEPLKDFAEMNGLASISSDNGEGRREAISLMGATSGANILKEIGLSLAPRTDLQRKTAEKKGRKI